jgi:hypothetical protein
MKNIPEGGGITGTPKEPHPYLDLRRDLLQNGHIGPRMASFFKSPELWLKKGGAGGPLMCRFKTARFPSKRKNTRLINYFPRAWTQVPVQKK